MTSALFLETQPKNFEDIKQWIFFNIPVWMPARIKSFDPQKQTATLELMMQSMGEDGQESILTYDPLQDVPVCFTSGGGMTATFSLKEGDQGIVLFSNRNLDNWKLRGGAEVPLRGSFGDLHNGVFLPGIRPFNKPLQGSVPDGFALHSESGDILFHVDPSGNVEMKGHLKTAGIEASGDIKTSGDVKTSTVSLNEHKHGNGNNGSPTDEPIPKPQS